MSETIENEIVRLIHEISEVEKELERLEEEAKDLNRKDYFKKGYAVKIKSCKTSLDRKMQLLRSLKG